jgi:hypothetical protein
MIFLSLPSHVLPTPARARGRAVQPRSCLLFLRFLLSFLPSCPSPPLRKTIKRKYMPHHVVVHRCVPMGRQAVASSCQRSLHALATSRDGVRAGVDLANLTVRAGVGLAGQTVRRGLAGRRAAVRDAGGEVRLASADAAAEGEHRVEGEHKAQGAKNAEAAHRGEAANRARGAPRGGNLPAGTGTEPAGAPAP